MGAIADFLMNIVFMFAYQRLGEMMQRDKHKKIEIKIPKDLK